MKKNCKTMFVIQLLLIISKCVMAQGTIKVQQPTFSGIVKLPGNKIAQNEPVIIAYKAPITPYRINFENVRVVTDKFGKFNFKLPKYAEVSMMDFSLIRDDKWGCLRGHQYIFEPDDSVHIEIFKGETEATDSIHFSGHGSEKFNVVWQLENLSSVSGHGEFRDAFNKINLHNGENIDNNLAKYIQLVKTYSSLKQRIIESLPISEKMRKMLTYSYGFIYSDWLWMTTALHNEVYKDNVRIRSIIHESFNRYRSEFSYKYDPVMALCPNYLFRQAQDEARYLMMRPDSDTVEINDLYNVFKSKYDGLARERFIVDLFTAGLGILDGVNINPPVMDSLMSDGQKYVLTPSLKEKYSDQLKLNKGNKVFNALFKSLDDKDITLNSLKGKVVLIDIWLTGCSACSYFHQSFHANSFPELKTKTDFVYLSVNIDKHKDTWLKSLKSDKYSSSDYLNVYSDLGFNHPFIKYYNISGVPFLLIVDKDGKIYSTKFGTAKHALELINEALMKTGGRSQIYGK